MKIILVGGGSGGHVLPLIAVQEQLEMLNPGNKFFVITDKIDDNVQKQFLAKTKFHNIKAGKFRRFAHWQWWQYFYPARFKFYLMNALDLFKIIFGICQSWMIIGKIKPDVIFAKGGYVSLPVGLVAKWRNIPLVLHDSDTRPGIANKLIAPSALFIASGLPSNDRTRIFTGVPIREEFYKLTPVAAKKQLSVSSDKKILLITGGSLGAKRINEVVTKILDKLTKKFVIFHISGARDYEQLKAYSNKYPHYKVFDFVGKEYPVLVCAADFVIGRAGATTIAEFAAAKKPAIFIPNTFLTDQVSNAKWLKSKNAGVIMDENKLIQDPGDLTRTLLELANTAARREELSQSISKLAKRSAATDVAQLIIKAAQ